jgi:Sigma-70 factor, region 1.1
LALVIEEKYDQVRQLINMERGCLLYDEVNDLLPAEVLSSEEIHDHALHLRALRHRRV